MPNYDLAIRRHYDRIAEAAGLSPTSTMADEIVRAKETALIIDFIRHVATESGLTILDVGCGNGYTLSQIVDRFPSARCIGIEANDKLRDLALQRRLTIKAGDVRESIATLVPPADVVICQRLLINLLDVDDQRKALANIIAAANPGGYLLFVEAFASSLGRLNEARAEFDFAPIPPAEHNLPLPDDFFDHSGLIPARLGEFPHRENELSTHFFITRVLHDVALNGKTFRRNSHFVRFFSEALPSAVGDFSPIKFRWFERARPINAT
jgi:SAM-dependent methyltransferase